MRRSSPPRPCGSPRRSSTSRRGGPPRCGGGLSRPLVGLAPPVLARLDEEAGAGQAVQDLARPLGLDAEGLAEARRGPGRGQRLRYKAEPLGLCAEGPRREDLDELAVHGAVAAAAPGARAVAAPDLRAAH